MLALSYGEVDAEQEFNIVGVSRYNTPRVSTSNLRPARTDCEPVSVASSFCECDFSDDRVDNMKGTKVLDSYAPLVQNLGDGRNSLSDSAQACLSSTSKKLIEYFDKMVVATQNPCDNPLPQEIMCADGSTSESVEYTEVKTEFDNKVTSASQNAAAVADSLFNHCLSL